MRRSARDVGPGELAETERDEQEHGVVVRGGREKKRGEQPDERHTAADPRGRELPADERGGPEAEHERVGACLRGVVVGGGEARQQHRDQAVERARAPGDEGVHADAEHEEGDDLGQPEGESADAEGVDRRPGEEVRERRRLIHSGPERAPEVGDAREPREVVGVQLVVPQGPSQRESESSPRRRRPRRPSTAPRLWGGSQAGREASAARHRRDGLGDVPIEGRRGSPCSPMRVHAADEPPQRPRVPRRDLQQFEAGGAHRGGAVDPRDRHLDDVPPLEQRLEPRLDVRREARLVDRRAASGSAPCRA